MQARTSQIGRSCALRLEYNLIDAETALALLNGALYHITNLAAEKGRT